MDSHRRGFADMAVQRPFRTDDLERRLRELSCSESGVKDSAKVLARAWKHQKSLVKKIRTRALLLLAVAAGDTRPVRAFVGHRTANTEIDAETLVSEVVEAYNELADQGRSDLVDDTLLPAGAALRQARRYFEEWKLHTWVQHQNLAKGIAPVSRTTATAWTKMNKRSRSSAASPKLKSQWQWLRRWRRRWDVRLGLIPSRETLPANICQMKASLVLWLSLEPQSLPPAVWIMDCIRMTSGTKQGAI